MPEHADTLYVLRGDAEASLRVKNSQFAAKLMPITSRSEALEQLDALRTAHPEAAHVVHAFAVGPPKARVFGQSDDGEPGGTAGKPVLSVLDGRAITNALLAVVRYFGGTKLGTGGLVDAYGTAARRVVEAARLEPLRRIRRGSVEVDYAVFEAVRAAIDEKGGAVVDEEFGTTARIVFTVAADASELLSAELRDITRGSVEPSLSDAFWG